MYNIYRHYHEIYMALLKERANDTEINMIE